MGDGGPRGDSSPPSVFHAEFVKNEVETIPWLILDNFVGFDFDRRSTIPRKNTKNQTFKFR